MEKPTILQIPRRFTKQEWGGTESVILHTSQELARRGYEVRILTSDLLSAPGEELLTGAELARQLPADNLELLAYRRFSADEPGFRSLRSRVHAP